MDHKRNLKLSNRFLALSFALFVASVFISYAFETYLPFGVIVALHVSQLILSGFFKVAYVVRIVSQKQLGLPVR